MNTPSVRACTRPSRRAADPAALHRPVGYTCRRGLRLGANELREPAPPRYVALSGVDGDYVHADDDLQVLLAELPDHQGAEEDVAVWDGATLVAVRLRDGKVLPLPPSRKKAPRGRKAR